LIEVNLDAERIAEPRHDVCRLDRLEACTSVA
jgi:hypothetical protein